MWYYQSNETFSAVLSHGAIDLVCVVVTFKSVDAILRYGPLQQCFYIALFVTQCWNVSRILTTGCLDCGVYALTI